MHKKRKTIIGLIVSLAFLALIFYKIDVKSMLHTFTRFDFGQLAAIIAIFVFSLLCRALRWMYLLKSDPKFTLYKLGSTWVIGNLMNAFLPARAGDIWRSYEIGAVTKDSKMKIFGSVMLERILDGVCVCIMLYFCIMRYANLVWIHRVADISMGLFGGSLIVCFLVVKFNKIGAICDTVIKISQFAPAKIRGSIVSFVSRCCKHLTLFVCGFEVLTSNYYTIQAVIMSFATWFLECLVTYFVISSFGINCPFSAAVFVICFVALSSMIPSSSIFVGPYQYAYILALGIYFIPKSEALAVAFVHQSILMGSLLVFSGIFAGINLIIDMKKLSKSDKEQNNLAIEV